MPTLHLDNVPDELYHQLEHLAAADQIPLAEETLRLLKEAVRSKQPGNGYSPPATRTQQEILEEIVRNRYTPAPGTPDSRELLREDRNR
jgi:hypothetical protein